MKRPNIRMFVASGRAVFAALFVIGHCAGCAETYTAALLRCVDKSATLAESKACRRHVDGDYGITETASPEGGK